MIHKKSFLIESALVGCKMRAAVVGFCLLGSHVFATQSFAQSGSPQITTLYSFNGSDGANPNGGLTLASDGDYYGTTNSGGTGPMYMGTVFRLAQDGTFTSLLSLGGPSIGSSPAYPLIQASDGNLYSTAVGGGSYSEGSLFRVALDGTAQVAHSFSGPDGFSPSAGLSQGADGFLYSTTYAGGTNGGGVVYRYSSLYGFVELFSFNGNNSQYGEEPNGVILGHDGNLYGTTLYGGANNDGIVYKLTIDGHLTILHQFNGADGAHPAALVQSASGTLYGVTKDGGDLQCPVNSSSGCGTVFSMQTDGTFTSLIAFDGAGGATPDSPLLMGADGNLYSTTSAGGNGYGTLFKLSTSGQLTTLYAFNGLDGTAPTGGLLPTSDGHLLGTTYKGGLYDKGSIFSFSTNQDIGQAPASPQGLTAQGKTRKAVNLTWGLASGGQSYNVYQGTAPGQESASPVLTGLTVATALVQKLKHGQRYCFIVRAVNAVGISAASAEACATP